MCFVEPLFWVRHKKDKNLPSWSFQLSWGNSVPGISNDEHGNEDRLEAGFSITDLGTLVASGLVLTVSQSLVSTVSTGLILPGCSVQWGL